MSSNVSTLRKAIQLANSRNIGDRFSLSLEETEKLLITIESLYKENDLLWNIANRNATKLGEDCLDDYNKARNIKCVRAMRDGT